MRLYIRIGSILALALLLAQCRKVELPPPQDGAPVFTLQGTVDGEPLAISAGDSNYIMRATFQEDSLGGGVYRGTFEELGCNSGCLPSASFVFRSAGPGPADPEADIRLGAYPLRQPAQDSEEFIYKIQFFGSHSASTTAGPVAYSWDFGDGSSSNLQNPEHEYPDDSPRFVRLETRNADGCTSSKEQLVTFEPQPVPCEVDFILEPAQGAMPILAIFQGPTGFYESWTWFEGDSTMADVYVLAPIAPQDTLDVCLSATTTEGCDAQTCQSVFLDSLQSVRYCATTLQYQPAVDTVFNPVPEPPVTVWVEYTDETGRFFSSALGAQDEPGGAFFAVTSRETFGANEDGLPTVKLQVAFRCELYGENGEAAASCPERQ